MKYGNTILALFGLLSLGVLVLWAISDLWSVMLVLFCIAGIHAMLVRKKS
jgi:uncharacterized membrane protein YqjE